MPTETIGEWEERTGYERTADQIGSLPETPELALVGDKVEVENRLCVALLGRITAGLGVQLLWDPRNGDTFITVVLDGETETFPVPPDQAREAFIHPYAYGATLPL